jgi:hypothetical protein
MRTLALGENVEVWRLTEDRVDDVFRDWKLTHQSKGTLSANWRVKWIEGVRLRLKWDKQDAEKQKRADGYGECDARGVGRKSPAII